MELLFAILAILVTAIVAYASYSLGTKTKSKLKPEHDEKAELLMKEFSEVMGYNLTKALERKMR